MSDTFSYDIIIVGAGVAGVTAALYAKRAGKKVAIIERMAVGGQLNTVGKIENYTGFAVTDGMSLVENLKAQIKRQNLEIFEDEVVEYKLKDKVKKVVCKDKVFECKSIILALGSLTRELEIDGEKKYRGLGVSYCAQCDGNFFKDKTVAVVGSSEEALKDVLYLSNLCEKVYWISKYSLAYLNIDKLNLNENVAILTGEPLVLEGDEVLHKLTLKDSDKVSQLDVDGMFIALGKRPNTRLLEGQIDLDENGFIICDEDMQTSQSGVYACGDVRKSKLKQIATAVGDGALAGVMASSYCLKN